MNAADTVTITPDLYHTSSTHRAIADRVLAAAGESRENCRQIDVRPPSVTLGDHGGATLTFLVRDADGYILHDGDELSTRVVYVEGAFL